MKKKVLAVLLTAAMAVTSLAACSGSGKEKAGGEGDKITLKYLNKYPEEQYVKYFEDAVKEYEKEHKNVDIVMENVSDEAIKDKLSVMASGGDMPDIFFSWSGEYSKKFARSGLAKDLTPYLEKDSQWKESFLPAFLNNSTFDGKTYGIPFRSSVLYMLYNKKIFKENNIEIPETYDKFLEVCETLKSKNITPISFGNSETWYSAWYIGVLNSMMISPETLNKDYNPESGEFTDPLYKDAMQKMLDMNEKGYFGKNVNSKDYYQVREEFCAGKAGMIMDATAQFSIYTEGMGDDYGFFKLPVMEGAKGDPGYVTGGAEIYCVSEKCKNPDEAVDFIKFMTSKEQAIKQTKESGLPNCIIGGITEENGSPILVEGYKTAEEYTNISDWFDTAVDGKVASQYMSSLQEALGGSKSADDIMKDVQNVAKQVEETYN